MRGNLRRLAEIYGSDKWQKPYPELYERHLGDRRRTVRTVLEIGIGGGPRPERGGASLLMWQRYFPRARIFGVDLYPKKVRGPRITVLQGDQSDPVFLAALARTVGTPDVIIDDGSHQQAHIAASFTALFPILAPGGVYVIEDMHTAYLPEYGGGPPGHPGTAVSFASSSLTAISSFRYWTSPAKASTILSSGSRDSARPGLPQISGAASSHRPSRANRHRCGQCGSAGER
ncbi:MAG TPA: class I SAM-dependent methyltransferase [Gemmatimonadales bacterium]|nr:class I SAM-dependent methyltransferase [Gemmatimonadales bacterium]